MYTFTDARCRQHFAALGYFKHKGRQKDERGSKSSMVQYMVIPFPILQAEKVRCLIYS